MYITLLLGCMDSNVPILSIPTIYTIYNSQWPIEFYRLVLGDLLDWS